MYESSSVDYIVSCVHLEKEKKQLQQKTNKQTNNTDTFRVLLQKTSTQFF